MYTWYPPQHVSMRFVRSNVPVHTRAGRVQEGAEKQAAFVGLLALLARNLDAAFAAFTTLCAAIASWARPPPPLHASLAGLVQSLKQRLEASGEWEAALARLESETLSPRVRTRILQFSAPAAH